MNAIVRQNSGFDVGTLSGLSPLETTCVTYLRLWSRGTIGHADIWDDEHVTLGLPRGQKIIALCEQLFTICDRFCRRPLTRNPVSHPHISADEASFARLVATAAMGEREDAMQMAMWLIRPDMAPMLIDLAAQFGLTIKQMHLRKGRTPIGKH